MSRTNIVTVTLAICFVVCVGAIVATVHRDGLDALKGSGLGALAILIAGALVRQKTNGK